MFKPIGPAGVKQGTPEGKIGVIKIGGIKGNLLATKMQTKRLS